MSRIQNNIAAGVLTLIPIVVTYWIVQFVVQTLIAFGRPLVFGLAVSVTPYSPVLADLLRTAGFQSVIALILVLFGLYVLGAMTKAVVGRKVIATFDQSVARVPFVRSLYGAVRRMLDAFQAPTEGAQRVVLIRFPTPEMRTLGFVTKVFEAEDRPGLKLAAVYVPTAPNPTSGYVEIVRVDDLVMLDWSTDEALQFVVSAGASARDRLPFGADLSAIRTGAAVTPAVPVPTPDGAVMDGDAGPDPAPAPVAVKTVAPATEAAAS